MTIVRDEDGRAFTVGGRVVGDPDLPGGTVVTITDPDGDIDDEGRPKTYPPLVVVRWDGRYETEGFAARSTAAGPWDDGGYCCDDIAVAV